MAFYNQGLPRFYLTFPFCKIPSLPDNEASSQDESEAEAKMVTVIDIHEEDLAALQAVIQSFRGWVVSPDELDAMGI
ncbi:MAG: hypothetical protein F6K28_54915 [Microcoleus sp. SIO2G3]|nr:hypothetical protein [Microcoleus sp. SIO2G3]